MRDREFTLDDARGGLKIDRDDLDHELAVQADVYFRVADACALAMSRRDSAKEAADMVFSEEAKKVRRLGIRDGERVTEAGVKEDATNSKPYREAVDEWLELKGMAERWIGMRDAYDMRARMIREMAQLYMAGYYQTADIRKPHVDQAATQQARKALREAANRKVGATR